jgi:hypothetical protein
MDNPFRHLNKPVAIWLVIFSCAFALVAGAALVTTMDRQPILSMDSAPPNGTPGSAQPGTMGLARPHAPLPPK